MENTRIRSLEGWCKVTERMSYNKTINYIFQNFTVNPYDILNLISMILYVTWHSWIMNILGALTAYQIRPFRPAPKPVIKRDTSLIQR